MEIKRCLIVDTETNGVDSAKHSVIEIGAILYSVTNNTTLSACSSLLVADSNEAESINTIAPVALQEMTVLEDLTVDFFAILYTMLDKADVIVAHQASFDKAFLTGVNLQVWSSKPWLCTREDFRFKLGKPGDSLVNIALAHRVGVTHNHRALTDTELLARIFECYTAEELQKLFQHALLPRNYYRALTGFAQKDLPKAAGFSWNPGMKVWWKKLTDTEAQGITFPIERMTSEPPVA